MFVFDLTREQATPLLSSRLTVSNLPPPPPPPPLLPFVVGVLVLERTIVLFVVVDDGFFWKALGVVGVVGDDGVGLERFALLAILLFVTPLIMFKRFASLFT